MAFLSPIIDNLLWKWYRGIEKIFFKLFFSRYFLLILCISFTTCMKCMKVFMWKSWLCQESKRGRFCFEKSKEAGNIFLTLWPRHWLIYPGIFGRQHQMGSYLPTSRGLPSNSWTRLCHSWTLCGFWRRRTLFRSSGRRSSKDSNRASRNSRSRSSSNENGRHKI